jgi:hypothetical protein
VGLLAEETKVKMLVLETGSHRQALRVVKLLSSFVFQNAVSEISEFLAPGVKSRLFAHFVPVESQTTTEANRHTPICY